MSPSWCVRNLISLFNTQTEAFKSNKFLWSIIDPHQIVPNFVLSLFSSEARRWRRLGERGQRRWFAISSTRSSEQTSPSFFLPCLPPLLFSYSLKQSVHPHSVNHVSVNIGSKSFTHIFVVSGKCLWSVGYVWLGIIQVCWYSLNSGLLLLMLRKDAGQSENIHNCSLSWSPPVVTLICQGCANPNANAIIDVTIQIHLLKCCSFIVTNVFEQVYL